MVERVKMKCRHINGTEWENDISNDSLADIESWPKWNNIVNIDIFIEAI